jgi:hypothetical protein
MEYGKDKRPENSVVSMLLMAGIQDYPSVNYCPTMSAITYIYN